jgi:hypothetical protein
MIFDLQNYNKESGKANKREIFRFPMGTPYGAFRMTACLFGATYHFLPSIIIIIVPVGK